MKKIFFLLLSAVAATTAWAQTTFTAGDLTYTVTDADAKTVSVKQANSQVGGALVIPTTVENDGVSYSVTSIAESGFKYNANITSVVFPASMRSTGESCFEECKNIASITLNEGLETIGDYLLWMRSGESSNAKLTTVTIPSTVTSIGRGAFYGCTALAEITFSGGNAAVSLDHISYAVFGNCPATTVNLDRNIEGSTSADFPTVQTLVVGNHVTKLHENMFKDCKQLTSVTLGSNLTEVGKACFYGCSALTGIDIPASIATLSESMFEECTRLASVTLHEGLTTVDRWAFYKCALTSVILPASVTSVGKNVFHGCPIEGFHISDSETELSVDANANIPGKNFYIGRNLTFAEGTSMFNDVETLTLGGNMTTIPESLARGKSTLKTLMIGEGIVNIAGATAFRETGLTSVSLPSSLKVLPQETFEKCYSLTTVTLAEGLEEIGHGAFYDCKALTEITLPASLKKIGKGVFHRNEALKKMVVADSDTELSFETSGYNYGTPNMTPAYTLDHIYVGRNIVRNDELTNSIIAQAKVVELGEKVTSLGYLMPRTDDVSDIYVPWTTPIEQTEDICSGNYSNITLWVPGGTKEAYQAADIWKKFTTMNHHSTLVTLTASAHGTIANEKATATDGSAQYRQPKAAAVAYTLTADTGYEPTALTDNGNAVSPLPVLGEAQSRANSEGEEYVTLVATFGPISYTLTYDLAGGTVATENPATYTIESDDIVLAAPTKVGHTFKGWKLSGEGEAQMSVTIAKGSTGNKSYTATWQVNRYTVTITGGGVTADNNAPEHGTDVVLTIAEDPDAALATLTVNGIEVTSQIADNKYTISNVSGNVTVAATWNSTKEFITMAHGQATFSCDRDLDFSEVSGLAAYIASGFDRNGTVLLSKVDVVPANTGLFLVGTEGATYKVPYVTATSYYVNLLKPVLTAKVVPATEESYTNFLYGENNGVAGFYKASGTGEVAAKKAYLQVPTSMAGSKSCLMIRFTDDEPTGIDRVHIDDVAGKGVYDLNGRRVADRLEGAHLPSGVYIVKGKKVYVK